MEFADASLLLTLIRSLNLWHAGRQQELAGEGGWEAGGLSTAYHLQPVTSRAVNMNKYVGTALEATHLRCSTGAQQILQQPHHAGVQEEQ
jgi:hypothetical protein